MDSHGKAAHRKYHYRENKIKLATAKTYIKCNKHAHAKTGAMKNINAPFVDSKWVGFFADWHFSNNLETGRMWLVWICLRTSSCKLYRKHKDEVISTWKAETSRPPPIRPIKEFSVELNRDDMTECTNGVWLIPTGAYTGTLLSFLVRVYICKHTSRD